MVWSLHQPYPSCLHLRRRGDIGPTDGEKGAPPSIVLFIVILILDPKPSHILSLNTGTNSMIFYDTAITVVVADIKSKKASGQCLRETETTPSLLPPTFLPS